MKNVLKIFGFTILVVAFYGYVGQMVPQQRAYPPETTELSADMSTKQMVQAGQKIVENKGTCLNCHAMKEGEGTGRFPNLAGIGAEASTRREGYSDIKYLAESLYEPNAYVVEGYNPAMPQVAEAPINLTDPEIKAVIAYLQSLGGTPTITMDTTLQYETSGGVSGGGGQTATASQTTSTQTTSTGGGATGGAASDASGKELFNTYLCNTCHLLNESAKKVGPSLYDVGSRLSRAEIYESIMEPGATVREGYTAGTMKATLEGAGFYQKVTAQQLQKLVDFLASKTGD